MSSTEHGDGAGLSILKLFFEEALPKAGDKPLFPLAPDRAAGSYWEPRVKQCCKAADMELECGSGAEFAAAFAAVTRPELAALAPSIGRLADELRQAEVPEGEVSPFLYVMF